MEGSLSIGKLATGAAESLENLRKLVALILAIFGAFRMDHRFHHATGDDPRHRMPVDRPCLARQQHRGGLVVGWSPGR